MMGYIIVGALAAIWVLVIFFAGMVIGWALRDGRK